jgi:hypothetical protein
MQAKRISPVRGISIGDTAIMPVLWPNWKLLARLCPMMRWYFS